VDDQTFRVRGQLTIRANHYNGTFSYLGIYTKSHDEWRLSLSSTRRVDSVEAP
jgi:hypothetical protein